MTVYGAIDCGSNSTRLLVSDGHKRLAGELRTTRLAEGVHVSRSLLPAAIERTVSALEEFREILDVHGVDRLEVVATSAARDAANSEEFLSRAHRVLGVRPRLISGDEEGCLTFIGATAGLGTGPYLVVDIGGGSTELICKVTADQIDTRSIDIGCVRLTEMSLQSDPYTRSAVDIAIQTTEDLCAGIGKVDDGTTVIAVAGTATTLAAIDLGHTSYRPDEIHGHGLALAAVVRLSDELSSMDLVERRKRLGEMSDRADVIVAGALIMQVVLRRLGVDTCVISENDILDGIVLDCMR